MGKVSFSLPWQWRVSILSDYCCWESRGREKQRQRREPTTPGSATVSSQGAENPWPSASFRLIPPRDRPSRRNFNNGGESWRLLAQTSGAYATQISSGTTEIRGRISSRVWIESYIELITRLDWEVRKQTCLSLLTDNGSWCDLELQRSGFLLFSFAASSSDQWHWSASACMFSIKSDSEKKPSDSIEKLRWSVFLV